MRRTVAYQIMEQVVDLVRNNKEEDAFLELQKNKSNKHLDITDNCMMNNPLMVLCGSRNYARLLEELLKRKAPPDSKNAMGYTALFWLAHDGHVATCQLMLDYGANICAQSSEVHSPFYNAVANKKVEVVELFIKNLHTAEQINFAKSQTQKAHPQRLKHEGQLWVNRNRPEHEIVQIVQEQLESTLAALDKRLFYIELQANVPQLKSDGKRSKI